MAVIEEKYYSILTNIGKAQIANGIGLGTKVDFVKMKIGDGNGSYYNPTESQLDLVHTVWEGLIGHVAVDEANPNWLNIEVLIPPDVGGFMIREYAVFDASNNMLAVAKCAETYKPLPSDGSTKEINMKMVLAVSNTSSITLKIDPSILFAKKSEVEVVQNQVNIIATEIQNARGTYQNLKARLDGGDMQFTDLTKDRIYYCGTTSGTNTYTASNSKITAYTDGLTVRVKIGAASTGASTININGLGAKTILDSLGNAITSGGLKNGLPYQLCYNGTNFIVLGKGGGGDATAAQIVLGKKATVDSGQIVGTLDLSNLISANIKAGITVNGVAGDDNVVDTTISSNAATAAMIRSGYKCYINGALTTGTAPTKAAATITPGTSDQTIASGVITTGVQTIKGDANLLSSNIKGGSTIFGVSGNSDVVDTSDALATAAQILSGSSAYVGGIKIAGTMVNRGAIANTIAAAGGTYTIPAGYHNGSGVVTAPSLATVTASGTVTSASQIVSGYKAYSDGILYTGTATITTLGGKKYAEGSFAHTLGTSDTITLPFMPSVIYITTVLNTNGQISQYMIVPSNNAYPNNDLYAYSIGSGTTNTIHRTDYGFTITTGLPGNAVSYRAWE